VEGKRGAGLQHDVLLGERDRSLLAELDAAGLHRQLSLRSGVGLQRHSVVSGDLAQPSPEMVDPARDTTKRSRRMA
jgi:hypothetical protein